MKKYCVLFLSLIWSFAFSQTSNSSSFEDFRVDSLFTGEKYPINYNSNPTAKRFKTRITDTYRKEGLNFGGHYCFVEWGCGSPCQASVIVDLKTGIVYDGLNAALGYEYRKESRMIIVNPKDTTGFFKLCPYCNEEIWILDEPSKKFQMKK
jgi:hypothetical protein